MEPSRPGGPLVVNDDDDEIVEAFLEESRENLDQLDRDLVELEASPEDPALLAQIFRTIHTIKGTCGFLGYGHLEALTHSGESLLGALRAGEITLDTPIVSSMLLLVDTVRDVLARIDATGDEGDDDHAATIAELDRLLVRSATATSARTEDSDDRDDAGVAARGNTAPTAVIESSVHVDVAVLDKLMDLVGELVLARGEIGELALDDLDGPLTAPYRKLRLVTSELQDRVMHARLQTVGSVTGKFRRVVRDLAAAACQAGVGRDRRRGRRRRQGRQRVVPRPAAAPRAQRGRPRHRDARRAPRSGQAGGRTLANPRLPRRRPRAGRAVRRRIAASTRRASSNARWRAA